MKTSISTSYTCISHSGPPTPKDITYTSYLCSNLTTPPRPLFFLSAGGISSVISGRVDLLLFTTVWWIALGKVATGGLDCCIEV